MGDQLTKINGPLATTLLLYQTSRMTTGNQIILFDTSLFFSTDNIALLWLYKQSVLAIEGLRARSS